MSTAGGNEPIRSNPLVTTFLFRGADSLGAGFTSGTLSFGDGSETAITSSDGSISHTYWSQGTFTARLTLTNGSEIGDGHPPS